MASSSIHIPLPPCGIYLGHGIYNTVAGYAGGSGYAYTNWLAESLSPMELIDLTVKENQGNLMQFWGGGSGPLGKARELALEDLGISIPAPDWENEKNLRVEEFPVLAEHRDRRGAGLLKWMRYAATQGIYTMFLYCDAEEAWTQQFHTAGDWYLGDDFGERFTLTFAQQDTSVDADLREIADTFCSKVRSFVLARKAKGWGVSICTSSNFYMDYEVAAGVDVTLFEDCTMELNIMSALSRGLHKQYSTPLWGAHIANEHYTWLPYANPYRFLTLRTQMFLKYLAGAKIIISESGAWSVQTTADDSPQTDTPVIPRVIADAKIEDAVAMHAEVVKHYPKLDHNSHWCRSYRKVMSDFYDYVKEHGTPSGQPHVTLALAKGNYDFCSLALDGSHPSNVIGGQFDLAERNPNWFDSAPERGWDVARNVFFPRPQGIFGDDSYNRLFSGTPYGQVDMVSFAFDQPSVDFLSANYRALIFPAWNTCSEKQYRVLCEYVRRGGILYISIPQLSTGSTRNLYNYTAADLVNGGDLSELCGVKVRGRGPRFYWATAPTKEENMLGVSISRRYGVYYNRLSEMEIVDSSMETLLFDHETLLPVLLHRKLGKGEVFFQSTWGYPGSFDFDYGPRCRLDHSGFVADAFRLIAKRTRSSVYLSGLESDEPDSECSFVAHSWFPGEHKICMQNIDFVRPHKVQLHTGSALRSVELAPQEFLLLPDQL